MKYDILINGAKRSVEFNFARREGRDDGRKIAADAAEISSGVYSLLLGWRSFEVTLEQIRRKVGAATAGREFHVEIVDPRSWRGGRGEASSSKAGNR